MIKKIVLSCIIATQIFLPIPSFALEMPKSSAEFAEMSGVTAAAFQVTDLKTGEILISKNDHLAWPAASLTKLVTALVVLDTKPKLSKSFAMTDDDQKVGGCSAGGVCIKTKNGVKFSVEGLFNASLIASANNATAALARSTGLSKEVFAQRMNEKVKSLGGVDSKFYEPTGMDPKNVISTQDYTKIISAAYTNSYLKNIVQKKTYSLKSLNNAKYNQTLKATNKLLSNPDVKILMAKTGRLDEAKSNFASVLRYHNSENFVVVVLGVENATLAFQETALLAKLAEDARALYK